MIEVDSSGAVRYRVELKKKDRSFGFELIIMDWQMPLMDGIETTRRIKANPSLSQIPIIMSVHS